MKSTLQPGISLTKRIAIDRDRTISFMGEEARVYATPSMIRDVEHACRELILQHADPGEESVGIEVAIKHLAATLPGMTVEIDVRVSAVEGRKVVFAVSVKDDLEPVCTGTHARFIVDIAKTAERRAAKLARWEAGKK